MWPPLAQKALQTQSWIMAHSPPPPDLRFAGWGWATIHRFQYPRIAVSVEIPGTEPLQISRAHSIDMSPRQICDCKQLQLYPKRLRNLLLGTMFFSHSGDAPLCSLSAIANAAEVQPEWNCHFIFTYPLANLQKPQPLGPNPAFLLLTCLVEIRD